MDLGDSVLHSSDILLISTGVLTGTIGRVITLKIDYRQIPSHPNGYFINLVAGFIASALGAVAIPALIAKDFAAITFLAPAIEQFREICKVAAENFLLDPINIYLSSTNRSMKFQPLITFFMYDL